YLTNDGLDDLVLDDSRGDAVAVALQGPSGKFTLQTVQETGGTPSDLAVTAVDGDGRPDVVVSDQATGDVTVLYNDAAHSFATTARFRAAAGPFGLDTSSGSAQVSSLALSVSLAAGDFTSDGVNDVVVVNRGHHSFSVLPGDGNGGFS